jgi:hypothetical protein
VNDYYDGEKNVQRVKSIREMTEWTEYHYLPIDDVQEKCPRKMCVTKISLK